MKLIKILFFLIIIVNVNGCADYKINKKKDDNKKYYSSTGFALIYDEALFKEKIINKKINNTDFAAIHNFLKPNTYIKIINPENSKFVETKVAKLAQYPMIFNIVINEKISTFLELDLNNPYVEVLEIKKNKTFIAKEGSIFDEEKNVANKAPVNEIEMLDITLNENKVVISEKKKISFILVISDFYYSDSAKNLRDELKKKININNISVKKINDSKYRLLVGPFKNFNALKSTYISLNNLGFEDLNIYKK